MPSCQANAMLLVSATSELGLYTGVPRTVGATPTPAVMLNLLKGAV